MRDNSNLKIIMIKKHKNIYQKEKNKHIESIKSYVCVYLIIYYFFLFFSHNPRSFHEN